MNCQIGRYNEKSVELASLVWWDVAHSSSTSLCNGHVYDVVVGRGFFSHERVLVLLGKTEKGVYNLKDRICDGVFYCC